MRLPVDANSCAAALRIAVQKWSDLGVDFDPRTMLLNSPATLQVKFVQQPVAESPCDPQVRCGYLGADNFLVSMTSVGAMTGAFGKQGDCDQTKWLDALADGSVRTIHYEVSPVAFKNLCGRDDGQFVNPADL